MSEHELGAAEVATSKRSVDPDLRPALDAMPSFSVNAESLEGIRRAVAEVKVPAPPAPETSVEERFVPGPDGKPLRVLVYVPEVPIRTGGLLWMHGGGMVMATPDGNEALCRYLAQTAGCVVAAVDYRLAPENPYPAGLEDCYAALAWMHAAADELGLPRDRLASAGESGGGCLAAGLSLLARDRGHPALSAQFLLYPMLDDRTGTSSEVNPMPHTGEFVWTRESNRFAWGAVLDGEPGGADVPAYAAPARGDDFAGVAPTSIFVGDLDLFLSENLRFAGALARSAVPIELHVYPGAYHGFVSFAQDAGVSQHAFGRFVSSITRHFRRDAVVS